jgi:hypothetical protein
MNDNDEKNDKKDWRERLRERRHALAAERRAALASDAPVT